MSRLVIAASMLAEIRQRLLVSNIEACAVLFARALRVEGNLARLVVHEVQWAEESDYTNRSEMDAELSPQLVAQAAQRARRSDESIIFVHSHPFGMNRFSAVDDRGETALAAFLSGRIPNRIHATMLVTPDVTIARILGKAEALEVVGVGPTLSWGSSIDSHIPDAAFDRQVRAFGSAGQSRLRHLRVGIVGVGGTGSVVLEQLAHLGVGKFLLIDPDIVELTNLNRLVGATRGDVGRMKVDVGAEHAERINPEAQVQRMSGSVLVAKTAEQLADVDFVFGCTDSHGSRAVLNQIAYQYLVPTIDMGVIIVTTKGVVTHVAGRTQMLAPELGCLLCGNLLNPEAVRVDLLSDFERANDRYVVGATAPAPAVISLNSTVASYAVTMFLNAVTGVPGTARLMNYNALAGTTRVAAVESHPSCIVCSAHGALARGNEWPLPARVS
jgi:molybdopterin/thiamine biosynthesis adenylyltransferase/proteasome lid subunit RPN8/RPN11